MVHWSAASAPLGREDDHEWSPRDQGKSVPDAHRNRRRRKDGDGGKGKGKHKDGDKDIKKDKVEE